MPFTTALAKAIETGDINIVASLIIEEKAWDDPNQEGLKPIHAAIVHGHLNVVDWLLKNGVSLECGTYSKGSTPLHIAAYKGQTKIIEYLLNIHQDNPNKKRADGVSPLHAAAVFGHNEAVAVLLDHGADSSSVNHESQSPLWVAAQGGHADTVALLLAHGADTRQANHAGMTPLYITAKNGHKDVVALLLAHGADPRQADHDGVTPLSTAAIYGYKEIVSLLLDHGADSRPVNHEGQSPLWVAAQGGHADTVALLLAHGADTGQADHAGMTPLCIAVQNGHKDVVALLLAHGADPRQADNDRVSPLCTAAIYGYKEIVSLLLDHGADIHQVSMNGASALFIAAQQGHKEVVALLLERGADVCQKIANGTSSLWVAVYNGHTEIVALLLAQGADSRDIDDSKEGLLSLAAKNGHRETVLLLLEHGADISKAALDGKSPLYEAAAYGHKDIVALLLARGADSNQTTKSGVSPLFIATQEGHIDVVALLLEHGANIHQARHDGISPLYAAACYDHKEIVVLLLAHGANVHQVDNHGKSPLFIAAQEGHAESVKLLLSHGANVEQASRYAQETPLLIAVYHGHREVVQQLLAAGAQMSVYDDGNTPLHVAVKQGHSAVVKLLLSHQAAVLAVNGQQQTPMQLAARAQDAVIFGLLLAAWFAQQKDPLLRFITRNTQERDSAELKEQPLDAELSEEKSTNQSYKPYGVYEKVSGVVVEGLLPQDTQAWPTLPATALTRAKATRKHLAFEVTDTALPAAKYLGKGAFGEVFRFTLPNQAVALKRIKLEEIAAWFKVSTEDAQNILQWEISQLEKVQHPHVVELLGISSNETPFIAMELCDTTLDKALPDHDYLQWQIAWEIACGLAYLHNLSLVHRDLKPENILLKGGIAKIADMGLAQIDPLLLDRREPAELQSLIGDLRFASPEEQAAFKAFKAGTGSLAAIKAVSNETTDIYRYGLVLKAFNNTSWQALSNACLQKDPQARPSALQILAALEQLIPHSHPALAKVCQRLGIFAHYYEHELSQFLVPWVSEQAEVDWLSYQEGIEVTGPHAPKPFATLWQDFLQSPNKSLEIRAAGGLGKTLLGYYYLSQQWQALRHWLADPQGEPPTVVLLLTPDYLPTTAFSVEERLQELYQLTAEELASLRHYPLVFLLDGEDEWLARPKIDLSQWPHAKCWILGRPTKAEESKATKETKEEQETTKADSKFYLLPFNQLQMVAYLSKTLNWDKATAQDFISQLPFSSSKDLLRNPFVLSMFSRLWPLPNWQHLTQETIYHAYFTHYIERQTQHWLSGPYREIYKDALHLLQYGHETLGESYLYYAGQVSLYLFEERRVEGRVSVISIWTTLNDQVSARAEMEYEMKKQLLAAKGEKTHLSLAQYKAFAIAHGQRLVLPPPLQEGYYRFMHKSLFEYAWAYTALLPWRPLEEDQGLLLAYARQHRNEKPDFRLIATSKYDPVIARQAGNLLTMYNWARLPLAYDYRGTHIENANLAYANLIGADLREATWTNCYFENACLAGAHLDKPLHSVTSSLRSHPPLLGHNKPILLSALSPDGQYIATLDQESVFIWKNQQRVRTVAVMISELRALAINNEGVLLIGDQWGMIYFFSADNSLEKKLRAYYNNPILSLAFINDQQCWVAGQSYHAIYDTKTYTRLKQWENDRSIATCASFAPQWLQQVEGSKNGEVTLVDVKPVAVKKLWAYKVHPGATTALSFSLTGRLAAGGANGEVIILERSGQLSKKLYASDPILSLHWSLDSELLVAITSQGFRMWDAFGREQGNFKSNAIQAIYMKDSHEGILVEKNGNLYGITLNNRELTITWVVAGESFQGGISIQRIDEAARKEKTQVLEQKESAGQNTDDVSLLIENAKKDTPQAISVDAEQEHKVEQSPLDHRQALLHPALEQQGLFADKNQNLQKPIVAVTHDSVRHVSASMPVKSCCTLV